MRVYYYKWLGSLFGLDIATCGLRYLRRSWLSRRPLASMSRCSSPVAPSRSLKLPEDARSLLVHAALNRWLLTTTRTREGVSRAGLGKRHRSQTRVNRCGALLSTHRRLSLALSRMVLLGFLLSPRGQSRQAARKLPSVNERSTLASPFCLLSGTFPRGSICLSCLSWCDGWLAADNVLGTAPGCAGCAAGRSVASRGFGRTPIRDFTSRNRKALLDNSTRVRTDRPLSLLIGISSPLGPLT